MDTVYKNERNDEETEFVYNELIVPVCDKCGFRPFAGTIHSLKWMKERGYNYCPQCGRKVKWDG